MNKLTILILFNIILVSLLILFKNTIIYSAVFILLLGLYVYLSYFNKEGFLGFNDNKITYEKLKKTDNLLD